MCLEFLRFRIKNLGKKAEKIMKTHRRNGTKVVIQSQELWNPFKRKCNMFTELVQQEDSHNTK